MVVLGRSGRKRTREDSGMDMDLGDDDGETKSGGSGAAGGTRKRSSSRGESKGRSVSRARSQSRPKTPQQEGFRNLRQKTEAGYIARKSMAKVVVKQAEGESDRRFLQPKPRHLFAGKRNGMHTASHR